MKLKLINDIKPKWIDSAYVVGPFDKTLKVLEAQDYKLISLEETAVSRMQEGRNHDISRNGNRVREGVLYVPGKGRFITRHSAILDDPRKATQANRNGKKYFVSDAQVEKALEYSVQVPYSVNKISTRRSGENEIAVFCFGENAKDYGLLLKDAGISSVLPLWLDNKNYVQEQGKPYANQLFLSGIRDKSALHGERILNISEWLRSRGIKVVPVQETYTPRDIAKAMEVLNLPDAAGDLIEKLRK